MVTRGQRRKWRNEMKRERRITMGRGSESPPACSLCYGWARRRLERPDPSSVIVQGKDTKAVGKLVRQVGGAVTHELEVINAVAADLTAIADR